MLKCGVVHLTKVKANLLNQEYDNLNHFLKTGEDRGVYSANKQQAKRYYKKIKDKEYPLSIRKDLIKVEKRNTKIAKYWARIPVKGRRGGVWVAIKPHQEIPEEAEICESRLMRRNGRFFLHLTVQKDVDVVLPSKHVAVIAIDIGEANPLTSVVLRDGKITSPKFLGKEVRGIRTLYTRIRKMIGRKRKKVKHGKKVIKQIGNKESRKVRDVLHKATPIVEQAKELQQQGYDVVIVVIVYGNLKNTRKPRIKGKTRCRKNNRKVHTMPSHLTKHMLTYNLQIPVGRDTMCWYRRSIHNQAMP